jgi:tetratricopeptide (TPR) repeat protein
MLLVAVPLMASGGEEPDAYTRGRTDLDARRFVEAERELAEAEAAAPGVTNALALRAKALIQLSRFEQAQDCLLHYVGTHAKSPDGWYLLGYVQFRRGKASESLASYTEAAKWQTPTADDLKIVGLDYVLLNDYADAERWLKRAVQMDVRNAEVQYHLGRTYYVENKFDLAIEAFQQALRIDPYYAKAGAYLGLCYAAKNESAKAESAYREAILLNGAAPAKTAEPYIDLADLLSHGSRRDDALPLLEEAERIGGKSGRTEGIRGRILFADNRLESAEAETRSALTRDPKNGGLHYLLGRILKKEGKTAEAQQEFAATKSLLADRLPEVE